MAKLFPWIMYLYMLPNAWFLIVCIHASIGNTVTFRTVAAAAAKLLQACLTMCDPIDGSPPGSLIPGILQARTLEWVAISFSNAWKWKVKVKLLSRVWLLATSWFAAYQTPPSMGFSRQEYWSGRKVKIRLKKFFYNSQNFGILLKMTLYWVIRKNHLTEKTNANTFQKRSLSKTDKNKQTNKQKILPFIWDLGLYL